MRLLQEAVEALANWLNLQVRSDGVCNATGIEPQSPGLRRSRYPGVAGQFHFDNSEGVALVATRECNAFSVEHSILIH